MTSHPAARTGRLLTAAELAFESGDRVLLEELLAEVRAHDLDLVDRARVEHLSEVFDFEPWTASTLLTVIGRADDVAGAGQPELALRLLSSAVARAYLADADQSVLARVADAADSLGLAPDHPGLLALLAYADPAGRGSVVRSRVRAAVDAREATTRPEALFAFARAAGAAGDPKTQLEAVKPAVAGLRAQGKMSLAVQALWQQASASWWTGDWTRATVAAAEAAELGEETCQPLWVAAARLTGSLLAAAQGDLPRARGLIDVTTREIPTFSPHQVERAEGVLALARERYEESYERFLKIFTDGDPAFHRATQALVVSEFAEAAAACGRRAEARGLVQRVKREAGLDPAPLLDISLALAEGLLAGDDEADALLSTATGWEAAAWPFLQARGQLAHGTWLRRRRKVTASRSALRLACQTFDRLGAKPWSERGRRELRAAGESGSPVTSAASLTPQELQISTLAAEGLTNRQIGERLFLSHRTVSSHLYQAYPKLGVTTRAQLSAVLHPVQASSADDG